MPASVHFARIAEGIDVAPLLAQIDGHPELWDRHRERTVMPDSPHREVSDIWLRYRPQRELTSPQTHGEPHFSEWYPEAGVLSMIRPMAHRLMTLDSVVHLGGILVTRIMPGCQVYPHHDRGTWHAEYHNFKVYVCLRGNEGCVNRFEDDEFVMRPGDAWMFNNQVIHACENRGDTERLSAIFAMRID